MHAMPHSGHAWLRCLLDDADLAPFERAANLGTRPGHRLGPDPDLFAVLAPDGPLGAAIGGLVPGARPVRLVAFDKRPETNWSVPWHQDRVIAIRTRAEVPGFTAWSKKGDTWHCEPPERILAAMLFVRIHLDDQDERNGAMQIAPGSHRLGKVPATEAGRRAEEFGALSCTASRGDVLVLDMLTLHRSQPSTSPAPRRAFRVDYAATDLPPPLDWAM